MSGLYSYNELEDVTDEDSYIWGWDMQEGMIDPSFNIVALKVQNQGEELISDYVMGFEQEIIEESQLHKVSVFWNYFQRWKAYYPIEQAEKKSILSWAEKTVYSRADAIVSGKHQNQYAEVAVLLAMVGEIKEDMGTARAREEIFAEYKRKYPRHSSFQKEMKYYFDVK